MLRFPRFLFQFFYPGIKLKRWIFLLLISAVVFASGTGGILGRTFADRSFRVEPLVKYERKVRKYFKGLRNIDLWLLVLGGVGMLFAVRRGYYAILAVYFPNREKQVLRQAYERARRKRGPRIVAIGGGTGLPTLLTGIKEYSENLTAIVTVADDGGSSGRIRRQFGILPPGDMRNCLVALADAEPLMSKLFQHRFSARGELKGHTFGNLFLTALAQVSGDFSKALSESSRVLAVRGRVLPVTDELVMLSARLANGRTVRGESRIRKAGSPVAELHLIPSKPRANAEALKEIARADIIIMGPGSLYTSIIPNLLVPGVRDAIASAKAAKVYVSNIMTEPGETDGMTAPEHLEKVNAHLGAGHIDAVVLNVEEPPAEKLERYRAENAFLVENREERLRSMGAALIRARLLAADTAYIRHDPAKLARAIIRYAVI
jgi:uncharacterized cofD-like protein